ncbi:MAG: serine hydrolase domain-containing protein [Promethearchaeota archaeon]
MIEQKIEQIESFLSEEMSKARVPGLSIGIIIDNKLAYVKGFGRRNIEKNLPMTANTLFGIGSVSKSFTALAIMQLVEQGKINLDDPVKKYIDYRLGFDKNPITIHNLLSHSSGVPNLFGSTDTLFNITHEFSYFLPIGDLSDFFLHLNNAQNFVKFKPGTHYFYNNDHYSCLDLILRNVSGLSLAEYMKEHVFKPLEMDRTTYNEDEFKKDPQNDIMTGYIEKSATKSLQAAPFPFNELLNGPGGIISSINEMANYMIMLLNEGKYNGKQILKKESIDKLWTRAIGMGSQDIKDPHYCYGWVREKFLDETLIHHDGNVMVSSAYCALIPDKKIGIVIGENCTDSTANLGKAILAILLEKPIEDALPSKTAEYKINKILGKYFGYRNTSSMEIFLNNTTLMAKFTLYDKEIYTTPLVVKNINDLTFYIPSIVKPRKQDIMKFYIDDENNEIYFVLERILMIKEKS